MWSFVFIFCSLQVLLRTTVFARMTPDQKTQLVKELQKLEWVQTQKGKNGKLRGRTEGKKLNPAEQEYTEGSRELNIGGGGTLINLMFQYLRFGYVDQ